MLLRLSPGTITRGLRDLEYVPGRGLYLPYPIELAETDFPSGTTLTAATLVIAEDFGLNPLLAKSITTSASAAGQILSNGAAGVAALYFLVPAADLGDLPMPDPLAFEVVVTDSRGLPTTLDIGGLVPSEPAGKPVDHVVVAPTDFSLAFPAQQRLTVTAYDEDDNVLTGRVVLWWSSDPGTVTVDGNGIVSVQAAGTATITAMVEGMTASAIATTSVPPALVLTLDWAPLVRRADLALPLAFVAESSGSGARHQGTLALVGSGTMGVTRVSYPKSADEWGAIAALTINPMDSTITPNVAFVSSHVQVEGPYDNTKAWKIVPNDAYGHNTQAGVPWRNGDTTSDNQDIATWKRGMAVAVAAATSADVGKSIRINFVNKATAPGGAGWYTYVPIKYQDVTLQHVGVAGDPTTWEKVGFNFDNYAQHSGIEVDINITMAPPDPASPLVSYLVAPYDSFNWQVDDLAPDNWLNPLPFHEALGVHTSFQAQNSWGADCDDPLMYNGGTKTSTAVAAPDSNRRYGGTTLKQFTLANGQGIQTDAAYRVEDEVGVFPSNTPVRQGGAAWIHWYIEPGSGALPADGALQAYVIESGGSPIYGPVNMVRDPWCGLQRANGGAFYRARVPINPAGEGYLDFSARIVNNSGSTLVFNATRAAMTAETQRSYGWHNAMVPARTVTGPQYSDSAWEWIANTQTILTVDEGIWLYRGTVPWSPGEIPNLNGNAVADPGDQFSPALWQSGPFGSADRTFGGSITASAEDGSHVRLVFTMSRGAPCPDPAEFRSWTALVTGIPVANLLASWPAMVDFDLALAWKNCAIVKFGIGLGTGNAMTWLNHGDTFLGGNVSITSASGLAWTIDGDTDGHLGIGDLDKVAETGGWYSALAAAGAGSVDAATVQGSIELHLARRFGVRVDHR